MSSLDRRRFVSILCLAAFDGAASSPLPVFGANGPPSAPSLMHDLMDDRRLMERVVRIYDEAVQRLTQPRPDFPPGTLSAAAGIVHRLVENYHVQIEEAFLFPTFRRAQVLLDLVRLLQAEHRQARRFTATIEKLATPATIRDPVARQELIAALRAFAGGASSR